MITGPPYLDRREAGQILAAQLREQYGAVNPLVLALPRGGVPVAFEVARAFDVPLDVLLVRKLGVPRDPELAMGAIASSGYEYLDNALIAHLGITPLQIAAVADRETNELRRREALYRAGRPPFDPRGRITFVIDDGLATGCTMRTAVRALRDDGANHLIVAVPVGSEDACSDILEEADALICPFVPEPFHAVGSWYRQFEPITDRDVQEWLAAATPHHEVAHAGHPSHH
jgi:predicted phosphoribosyltransferase